MNIDIKKLATIGAVGLLGFGLAACDAEDATGSGSDGGGDETSETASGAAEETAGDGTSPDSPLPAGTEVEIGDWTVTVSDVELDATETILAENEFNEEPADGNQFAMYTVEGTYNGDEAGTLWLDLTIGVFAGGTYYSECSNVVPGDLIDTPEVANGGTASGNGCAEFPSAESDGAIIYIEDLWSIEDDNRIYLEIA